MTCFVYWHGPPVGGVLAAAFGEGQLGPQGLEGVSQAKRRKAGVSNEKHGSFGANCKLHNRHLPVLDGGMSGGHVSGFANKR
jgi:hypothetical protein